MIENGKPNCSGLLSNHGTVKRKHTEIKLVQLFTTVINNRQIYFLR